MTDLFEYDNWPSGEPYDWAQASRGPHPDDNIDFHLDLGCGRLKKGRIGVDRYPAAGVNVVADLNTLDIHAIAPEPGRDAVEVNVPRNTTARVDAWYLGVTRDGDSIPPFEYGHGSGYKPRPWNSGALPFKSSSIESIISHHALEHIGDGFISLMDECYRILKPGGILRAIVPLFPSWSAVADPDHKRYFLADEHNSTFDAFCGTPGDTPLHCFLASFSVPYTKARFERTHQTITRRLDDQLLWWTAADDREMRITLKAMK